MGAQQAINSRRLLGIEGGGTRTVALYREGSEVRRWEGSSANLGLLTDVQLLHLLRDIAQAFPRPDALAIGLAGARTEADRARIRRAAAQCWPGIPCLATNDLETGLAAQPPARRPAQARVLVLSGTGSCCYGQSAHGAKHRVGGWGHLLGDHGSSYDIAFTALRRAILVYDLTGRWPQLGARLLRRLQFNEPNELIGWVKGAAKDEIAALAVEVFEAAKAGDKLASGVLRIACEGLVADALACAKHLAGEDGPVEFILAGGTLLKQPRFATAVKRALKAGRPNAKVFALERESAWGALELAAKRTGSRMAARAATVPSPIIQTLPLSPTEERNPRSMNLHRLPLGQAIDLMISEDARILPAIKAERTAIENALRLVVHALKKGGRLFYVGAGTSGRLGVLDASECPPTFRTPPGMIQGIIAGGRRAIWEAVEGAEDDTAAGASAIKYNGVCRRDVVVGIAASGRTPFVWGALEAARAHGAKTVMLCFNPRLQVAPAQRPDVLIAINTGPEILTGSTRLKAGTATKLVLNLLTTLAMVQLGKVAGNLMVDLLPSNAKLRDRAVRIVVELTGASPAAALDALEKTGWVIKAALKKLGSS